MAQNHKDIADINRHENKGASTATAGYVLKGNGDGTSSFVDPKTLINIGITSTLQGESFISQTPAATDTPLQITWGSGSSNANASIASNGIITITTAGLYDVNFYLNFGRAGNTGIALLVARILINDIPIDSTIFARVDTSTDVTPITYHILRAFSATDTIKVQILRDSTGNNDGGLITFDPTLTGWANSPSASVKIQKIAGA